MMVSKIVTSRRGKKRIALLLSNIALAGIAATTRSQAQTAWTGATSTDWFNAGNWTAGVPTNAITSDATVDTVTPNATVIGAAGAQAHDITVGNLATGTVTIQNGGTAQDGGGVIGSQAGSNGTVTVTGVGSS
jgi:hypothetical protein